MVMRLPLIIISLYDRAMGHCKLQYFGMYQIQQLKNLKCLRNQRLHQNTPITAGVEVSFKNKSHPIGSIGILLSQNYFYNKW